MAKFKLPSLISSKLTVATALAAFSLVPVAKAGTYSVIGVQWFDSYSYSGGGYIGFSGLDIVYGLGSNFGANAPWFTDNGGPPVGHTGMVSVANMVGSWQWIVQWVGAPGEAHPGSINGIAEYLGSSTSNAYAMSFGPGGVSSCTGSLLDIFYAISNGSANGAPGQPEGATVNSSANNIIQNLTVGGTFVYVSGTTNTWQAPFADVVNDIAQCTANGTLTANGYGPLAEAGCSIGFSATVRLCFVGGQRVQPDL